MKLGAGSTAVVTGGGGGLGRSIALELARRGARVLISDVDGDAAAKVADELRGSGARAESVRCDVSRLDEIEALARRADELFGATDLLVNNAGVAAAGAMGEIPIEDWRWVVDVDLWGPIYGCHTWVPRMKRAGRGHILNVASIAGVASAPLMGPYNVSKAGVISLSETLAAELDGVGVGVTVLCPFFFQTNVMKSSRTSGQAASMGKVAEKLMRESKLSADDVARIALDACEAGRLYCMAHREAKAIWAAKRLVGERFRAVVKLAERANRAR